MLFPGMEGRYWIAMRISSGSECTPSFDFSCPQVLAKPGRSFAASRQAPARAPWLSFPRAKVYPSASMPPGAIALRKSGGHDRLMTKFDGA
jgi:hypothetical protein